MVLVLQYFKVRLLLFSLRWRSMLYSFHRLLSHQILVDDSLNSAGILGLDRLHRQELTIDPNLSFIVTFGNILVLVAAVLIVCRTKLQPLQHIV